MEIKLTWGNMSACIDANPTINFFYTTEKEFVSNKPGVDDIDRYYIRQTLGNDENVSFITKDGGADQVDFDTNYKTLAIAIETL